MWLIWFLVSSVFYFFLSSLPQTPRKTVLRRLPVDYAFILVVLILWLAYQIWAVGNAGPTHFFMNLRASSNQATYYESLGFVGRLYPWVFALFIFEHVNSRDGNRRLRLLLWCWMLLYAFATMGKFSILTPFLAWAVIKGIRRSLPMRNLFLLLPFLFGIMIMLHFLRTAEGERFVFSEFLSVYTYSPIVALGYADTQTDPLFGAHVFRFLYALMHAIDGRRGAGARYSRLRYHTPSHQRLYRYAAVRRRFRPGGCLLRVRYLWCFLRSYVSSCSR